MNEVWQILCVVLLLAAAGAFLSGFAGLRKYRWVGMMLMLLIAIIPFAETSIWLWMRGLIGGLSILSFVLLTGYLGLHVTGKEVLDRKTRSALYATAFTGGLLLYPATLGLSLYDPYRLGFGIILAIVVLGLSVLLWFAKRQLAAVVLVVVVLADQAQLMTSINTWDYLIDPLVWIIAPFMLLRLRLQA